METVLLPLEVPLPLGVPLSNAVWFFPDIPDSDNSCMMPMEVRVHLTTTLVVWTLGYQEERRV